MQSLGHGRRCDSEAEQPLNQRRDQPDRSEHQERGQTGSDATEGKMRHRRSVREERVEIKLNAFADRKQLAAIKRSLEGREALMGEVAAKAVTLAKGYFTKKSKGQPGIPRGRVWKPLKQSTLQKKRRLAREGKLAGAPELIGVETGQLQRMLTAEFTGTKVRLSYHATEDPKRKFADLRRPAMPTRLPRTWRRQLEASVMKFTIKALTQPQGG